MKLLHAIPCRLAIVSRETNALTIVDLLERIPVVGFPLVVPEITFITIWEREANDVDEQVGLFTLLLNDQKLMQQEVKFPFRNGHWARNQMVLQVLVIPAAGKLRGVLSMKNHPEVEFSIPVLLLGEQRK